MTLFALHEDRPTPRNVYNIRVYFCAAVAAFCAVMIGYDSAFIGTSIALTSFKNEFNWSQYSDSESLLISENIVSLYQAGAFFGAFFAYPAGHFLGRRIGLAIFSGIFILGAGLMCGATGARGLGLIYAGRVLAGLGVGGASNLTPIYISEVAPPAIRGRLVGLYELGWQIGGLVGFWINYGVSTTLPATHKQWLIPFAVQLIPAGMMFVGIFLIKESPRWLFSRDRREEAIRNLCWLRKLDRSDIYIIEEMNAIDYALEEQKATVGLGFWGPFLYVFSSKAILYRFFIAASMFFWQNASGINAINYYSPTVFKSIGVTGSNTSLFTTGIFGVVKTIGAIVWLLFMVDQLGRRNLLMFGALGGSICLWYVGAYIKVAQPANNPTSKLSSGGISAMAFFYLWTVFYSSTWNGTPWVYCSEVFNQNYRTLGQAFAAANNWLWNFIVARFTAQMFEKMGYGVYFFFASLMICSIVFVWFILPETKGIPLEAIDKLFSEGHPPHSAHRIVMQQLRDDDAAFRENVGSSDLKAENTVEYIEEA